METGGYANILVKATNMLCNYNYNYTLLYYTTIYVSKISAGFSIKTSSEIDVGISGAPLASFSSPLLDGRLLLDKHPLLEGMYDSMYVMLVPA